MLETLMVVLKDGSHRPRRIDALAKQVVENGRSRFKVTGLTRRRIRAAFDTYVQGKWVVRGHPATPAECRAGSAEGIYIVERVQSDTATLDDTVIALEAAIAVMMERVQDVVRAAIAQPGSFTGAQYTAPRQPAVVVAEQDAFAEYGD